MDRDTAHPTCLIISPYGQMGGGMGRITDYIMEAATANSAKVQFLAVDTRGNRHSIISLLLTVRALGKIVAAKVGGRLVLVHVNMAERASVFRKWIVLEICRLLGIPAVLHLHAAELIDEYDNGSFPYRAIIARTFRLATCNVVLGSLWKDWMSKTFSLDPSSIEIVYNGAPGQFVPGQRCLSVSRKILFLGNLSERKGVTDLMRALASLAPDPWQAIFAGGGNLVFYEKLADELGIGQRCQFPGWVDQQNAQDLIAAADILVLPSYNEGLPLVILEALGKGTPVVATPVGAIPEVLTHAKDVLFVAPGDSAGIAERIAWLFADEHRWKMLSEQGGRVFNERFTLKTFTGQLFSVYQRRCGVSVF